MMQYCNFTIVASIHTDDASIVATRQVSVELDQGQTPEAKSEELKRETEANAVQFLMDTVNELLPNVNISVGISSA